MRKIMRTGVVLSSLLAWSAFAQQAPQPTQNPSAATGQSAPTPGGAAGAPVGSAETVTLPAVGAVSTTALAVGAVAAVVIGAVIVSNTKDDTGSTGTR